MGKLLKRMWRYITAALSGKFNEAADPKIQIEQAIREAQDQHRSLTERAASVIANQKKAEMDLDRTMADLDKLNASTRQAVIMAEEAAKRGDNPRAAELTQTAEAFASQLVAKEESADTLKQLVLQSTSASDQAKSAVNSNAMRLQQRLSERQKLLSQLDQAKMQEQMNAALESVSSTVGQDVPSLDQVRDKIEGRYARARGMSELQSDSVEGRMLEVEQAAMNTTAQARLSEIKSRLGITTGTEDTPAPLPASGTEAPAAEGAPATEGEPRSTGQG